MRQLLFILVVGLVVSGCRCGPAKLQQAATCENDPTLCDMMPPPDAGPIEPPGDCPAGGTVTGRVCATDQRTWVNGAAVSVDATDCHGAAVKLMTLSRDDGTFSLDAVPPGSWTIKAESGSFQQDTPVTVASGTTVAIPVNQLCVAQRAVRIAVVTGPGDKIEDLLTSLQLTFTTYDGSSANYATAAAPFLADLNRLKQYDIIFIDCAAAKSGTSVDLGTKAAQIQANLKAYVEQGGSIYASDWAALFAVSARPGGFDFLTRSGHALANPMPTTDLEGYAPQVLTAKIADPALATFLGKTSVEIAFPKASGASSLHWGLMQNVSGPLTSVLVSAVQAQTCSTSACTAAGMSAMGIPLAARIKVTAADKPGGQVVYTSFHNIGQSGNDVAQILKYLILHL